MEYDDLLNRGCCDFLVPSRKGVQVQIADRAAGESSKLQVDELTRVRDSDAFGMDGAEFTWRNPGAWSNPVSCSHLSLSLISNIVFINGYDVFSPSG